MGWWARLRKRDRCCVKVRAKEIEINCGEIKGRGNYDVGELVETKGGQ